MMNKVQRSQAFLRKRKMMVVFPLLITPFLTMAFWAMGGGKVFKDNHGQSRSTGLNLQLPVPNLKENKAANKMSFYDQASKDSIKLAEQKRNDPYFHFGEDERENSDLQNIIQNSAEKYSQSLVAPGDGLKTTPYDKAGTPTETKMMKKLAELNELINHPEAAIEKNEDEEGSKYPGLGNDVTRLENMMRTMREKKGNDDPEIKSLENTLDKILDIQHPERVKSRTNEKSADTNVLFSVSKVRVWDNLISADTFRTNGIEQPDFWGYEDKEAEQALKNNNSINAVIHENQVLVNGSVIKLRLTDDIYINGELVSKGNFVYGVVSLNGERLQTRINSIRCGGSIYPVKLEVYDIDGIPGIYIPGAITRDVAKQSADNSLQLMELSTINQSLKAQATAAGIGAAKNLLSKKVRMIKVMVKAGYKVILKGQ